jgi:hypothetical protein
MKFLAGLAITTLLFGAAVNKTDEPKYAASGALLRPDNYRQWTWLTSGFGMAYAANAAENPNPPFDNVFVNPSAYRSFLETGKWPDKTTFVLEIRASVAKESIDQHGHSQGDVQAIEVHVKDEKHFARKWGFFGFANAAAREGKQFADNSDCYTCHEKSGALETTFAQFYPTVREVAKQKGTLKAAQ